MASRLLREQEVGRHCPRPIPLFISSRTPAVLEEFLKCLAGNEDAPAEAYGRDLMPCDELVGVSPRDAEQVGCLGDAEGQGVMFRHGRLHGRRDAAGSMACSGR